MSPINQRAARPAHRRERILDAAIALFHERGYHATGIDDIGEAAGITGPGIYRHFPSKHHLLVALFDATATGRLDACERILASSQDERAALEALARDHAAFAIASRSVIAVYLQELGSLSTTDARRIRRRQRKYLDVWVRLLRELRPELGAEEALSTVHAAIGVIHSVAWHESRLDAGDLHALLSRGALAVLLARDGGERQMRAAPSAPAG